MKRRIFFILVIILFSAGGYFIFFYQNKTLKYIPENADVVVLVDSKKVVREYVSEFLAHPSEWFRDEEQTGQVSWQDSGLRMPDFIQIFHLKGTGFSEWYTVLEIKDKNAFSAFLKKRNFVAEGKNSFQKDHFFVSIHDQLCIVSTKNFKDNAPEKLLSSLRKDLKADVFMENSLASISLVEGMRTQNFLVAVKEDAIEIKNTENSEQFSSLIAGLEKNVIFLNAELHAEKIQSLAQYCNADWEKAGLTSVTMSATLEQVQDTIISYGYDDDFNEIEKVSYQKLVQPNYDIQLETQNKDQANAYFHQKKWVNAQGQFTEIPFQPNRIAEDSLGFRIYSTRKPVKAAVAKGSSFIFIKNNPLLFSSFKSIATADKAVLRDMEYLFAGFSGHETYMKIQFKKKKLPLILR